MPWGIGLKLLSIGTLGLINIRQLGWQIWCRASRLESRGFETTLNSRSHCSPLLANYLTATSPSPKNYKLWPPRYRVPGFTSLTERTTGSRYSSPVTVTGKTCGMKLPMHCGDGWKI